MRKILFAMAVIAALASCQKADLAEQNSANTNGERVITAYFDNAGTKTTLDGDTPKWTGTETIMILNGSTFDKITSDEIVFSSDGKSITFTTSLEGPLYAVYPSDATDAEKIVTEDSVPVTLKAEQDGTFASANICVAKENDGSLAFKNVTSVLHLTQIAATTKVNEIIITTPSADIAGAGTVNMSATTPTLALSPGQSKKIKVKSASPQSDYYIAVAPTTLPAGTAFGFATGSELGGTNLSEEKTIAANTIYNIGSMDESEIGSNKYHEYVEIGGLKWATMNVGATSATEAGKYFMWGETTGITPSESSFSFPDSKYYSADNDSWDSTKGFAWENCPHTEGTYDNSETLKKQNVFTKYTIGNKFASNDTADGLSILESADDAATSNWGGSWRMPTGDTNAGDFIALFRACGITSGSSFTPTPYGGTGTESEGVYWCNDYYDDDSGVKGALFIDENGTHLFFPAAGQGNGCNLNDTGDKGFYWSNNIPNNENFSYQAYKLQIASSSDGVAIGGNNRCSGISIRPVSD